MTTCTGLELSYFNFEFVFFSAVLCVNIFQQWKMFRSRFVPVIYSEYLINTCFLCLSYQMRIDGRSACSLFTG